MEFQCQDNMDCMPSVVCYVNHLRRLNNNGVGVATTFSSNRLRKPVHYCYLAEAHGRLFVLYLAISWTPRNAFPLFTNCCIIVYVK